MGSINGKCYQEDLDAYSPQEEQKTKNKINIEENKQEISCQNMENQIYGQNEKKDSYNLSTTYSSNIGSFSKYKQESTLSLPILSDDKITRFTTSQFQIILASQTPIFSKQHFIGDKKEHFFDLADQILEEQDYSCLICIKWCVTDFFLKEQQYQPYYPHQELLQICYNIFHEVSLKCMEQRNKLNQLLNENENEKNIELYLQLYNNFINTINNYDKQYDILTDIIQVKYDKIFKTQNNSQIPHFKLVGYLMRFWCQITLTQKIQKILLNSYKNIKITKEKQQLIYKYVCAAIDVNVNEVTIHQIGHSKKFNFYSNLKLIDISLNQIEKQYNQEPIIINKNNYNNYQWNEKFEIQMCFPGWLYEYILSLKYIKQILNLVGEMRNNFSLKSEESQISDETILEIYSNSQAFDQLLISLQSYNEQIHQGDYKNQIAGSYLDLYSTVCDSKEFKNKLTEISDSKVFKSKSTDISDSKEFKGKPTEINMYPSVKSLEMSRSFGNPQKEQLIQYHEQLVFLKQKTEQRNLNLDNRAQFYDIDLERKIEWLDFFQKTNLVQISQTQGIFKKYIIDILKSLSDQNQNYEIQLNDLSHQ